MCSDEDAAIRRLEDREAIRELANRYAHCVWRKDPAGVAALFGEDGEMDTGDRPPIRGRSAIREEYVRILSGMDLLPFVHNHLIELDGDRASGICYIDLRASVGGRSMIGAGHYDDRYVRVGGAWKFRSRKLTMSHFAPLREGWAEPKP